MLVRHTFSRVALIILLALHYQVYHKFQMTLCRCPRCRVKGKNSRRRYYGPNGGGVGTWSKHSRLCLLEMGQARELREHQTRFEREVGMVNAHSRPAGLCMKHADFFWDILGIPQAIRDTYREKNGKYRSQYLARPGKVKKKRQAEAKWNSSTHGRHINKNNQQRRRDRTRQNETSEDRERRREIDRELWSRHTNTPAGRERAHKKEAGRLVLMDTQRKQTADEVVSTTLLCRFQTLLCRFQ
jgi:hypothetical protein